MDYIQAVGYVGYAFALWAGFQKKDNRLFLGFSLSSFLFAIHHYLLNNQMAAASAALIGCRMYLNQYFRGIVIAVPFSLTACLLAYLTYQDAYSLLPLAAVLIATIGTAYTKGIPLRLVFIFCCTCWLIHDIAKGSQAGALQDFTNICVHSFTVYRLKKSRKKSGSVQATLQLDRAPE